jgi:cytochrome c-type biogenesis protein CcmH/NrfG
MVREFCLCVVVLSLSGVFGISQQDAAIYFTGKLVLEDGSPAPRSLQVEFVCSGKTLRQTHPSKSGVFSFDLGSRQVNEQPMGTRVGGIPSGGVGAPGVKTTVTGRLDLKGCRIRLVPTAGYAATEVDLSTRNFLDKPDIGLIVVRELGEGQHPPAEVTTESLAIPAKALSAFEKAQTELAKKKVNHKKVVKELEKAVNQYPGFPQAWHLLGESWLALNDLQQSREAFEHGIASGPDYVPLYLGLAQIELAQNRWVEAAGLAEKALAKKPTSSGALFYGGLAKYYLGQMAASEEFLRKLRNGASAANYPVAALHLGMIYARKGEVPAAAEEFRAYLDLSPKDQIPPERRDKLEKQLKQWQDQGLLEGPNPG